MSGLNPAPEFSSPAVILSLSDSPAALQKLQDRVAAELPRLERLVNRCTKALKRDPEKALAYLTLLRSGIDEVFHDLSDID